MVAKPIGLWFPFELDFLRYIARLGCTEHVNLAGINVTTCFMNFCIKYPTKL